MKQQIILIIYPSITKGKKTYISSLIDLEIINYIKLNYIPCLIEENTFKKSLYEIEDFLNNNDYKSGAYICSCGNWYKILECGLPLYTFNCPFCKEIIGGTFHIPYDRNGHYRIFKDKSQEDFVMKWVNENNWLKKNCVNGEIRNFRSKIFSDFKNEVENMNDNNIIGFIKYSKEFFIKNKNIRNLNQITIRLIECVFYECLLLNWELEYLYFNDLENLIPNNYDSIFDVLTDCFDLLESELEKRGIKEIEIFFNMIYNKIGNLFINYEIFNTIEIRNEFENKINLIIEESINNYEDYKKKYIEINNELNRINLNSYKCIIEEYFSPEIYPENKYPFFKYFMLRDYQSKNNLKKRIELIPEYEMKYPIINNLLNDNGEIETLKNLIKINPFINSMINIYSYKISREEAKQLKIKDELKRINNPIINKEYEEFKEGWNNIYIYLKKMKEKYLLKYDCFEVMEPIIICDNDPIAKILNDDGELFYGMYIAATYQLFISWQNTFLSSIKFSKNQNSIKNIDENEIYIQNAINHNIIHFSFYKNFNEIIYLFSKRNCYNNDWNINYNKYYSIEYNFDLIEKELGKILLGNIKYFKTNQKFIIYNYEAFYGDNSNIIYHFIQKYNKISLKKEEKEILYNFFQKETNINFLFTLQFLLNYLKNENYKCDLSISEIIYENSKFISIEDKYKIFFESYKNFKLINFISIYEYIEFLCFPILIENVDISYKLKIDEEEKNKLNEYFKNNNVILISKELLLKSIRKFISRFLTGKRINRNIKDDENILYYLKEKEDLWSKTIFNDIKFEDEFNLMIKSFSIKINQSIELYKYLNQLLKQ
jgi:hypothetical protein